MKKNILLLAALALFAACAKELPGQEDISAPVRPSLTFTADAGISRTSLGSDWSVNWVEGDEVAILWRGGRSTAPAVLEGGKVRFSATVDEVSDYFAVYPASIDAAVTEDGRLNCDLPSAQDGSFAGNAVIVAHTTRESLDFGRFHSAVSMIRFTLEDASISRIRFSAADGSAVGGSFSCAKDCSDFSVSGADAAIELSVSGAGTYYLALLPGLSLPGLTFQAGTSGSWKGTATSSLPVSLGAGQVLCIKSPIDGHIVVEGDFFITPEGSGLGDGSSWENAGNASFLRTLLGTPSNASVLDGHTVHIGAGNYDLSSDGKGLSLTYDAAVNLTLKGESGAVFTTSLSGEQGCILTVPSSGVNLVLDGIHFTGASHDGPGGALCLSAGAHTVRNCSFSENKTTSTTNDRCGGAVYIGGTASADIENCAFSGNQSSVTGGGALAVFSAARTTLTACRFTGNKCHNGSAYAGNGGAVLQKKSGNTLYVVNCSFSDNGCNTNGSDIFSSAGASLMLYNCTFAHPAYPAANSANRGLVRANVPVFSANCTFVMEVDADADGAGCNNGMLAFGQGNGNAVVNNLMLSNAGRSFGAAASYSSATTRNVTSYGYNVYGEAPKINFSGDGVAADRSAVHTADIVSSTDLSEAGFLVWDGPQAKLPGFGTADASAVQAALEAYGAGGETFYLWLTEKQLFGKDAAGTDRGASWWPGAYQQ